MTGDQRGGTLGYPTANIALDPSLACPGFGIYAGSALDHRAAVSIGTNPHYGGTERRIEPYLLDFDGDLYGKRLVVELWQRLRDEAVFATEEELVAADRPRRRGDPRRAAAELEGPPTDEQRLDAILVVGIAGNDPCREPGLLEEVEARVLREESVDVVVVDESGRLPGLVEDDRVVDLERRFSGVRIRRPLEVAESAAVGAVMTAVVGSGDEGLARAVGYEERDTARARVRKGGAHARAQVVLAARGTSRRRARRRRRTCARA